MTETAQRISLKLNTGGQNRKVTKEWIHIDVVITKIARL
jgi:hypothetical protein